VLEKGSMQSTFTFEQVDQLTEEFDYFADRLLTDRDIYPDGAHGVVDLKVIDAIYRASEMGQSVDL